MTSSVQLSNTDVSQLEQPFKVFVQQNGRRQLVYTDFRIGAADDSIEIGAIVERGVPVLRGFAALINIGMPRTFHVRDSNGHDVWIIKRPAGTFGRGPRVRRPDGTSFARLKWMKSETRKRVPTLLVDGKPEARIIPSKVSTKIVDPFGVDIVTIHHVARKTSDTWFARKERFDYVEFHRPAAGLLAGLVVAVVVRRHIAPPSLIGNIISSVLDAL